MGMNLVLQSVSGDLATRGSINAIASDARAKSVTPLSAHAWRFEDVSYSDTVRRAVHARAHADSLDSAFVAPGQRLADFRLVVMDMDSTLITIECIDEIADMHGLKPQVAAITEAAMRGELDFRESLTRRVALLQGLDAGALQRVVDERLELSPGAETMLAAVKAAGLRTLLVSGGFTYFTERMQARLGLDTTRANVLEIADGRLTGKVIGDIVDSEAKQRAVLESCTALGIAPRQAIVIGDGANDLKMMAIAGMSVAFHAKPLVREKADVALNFVGLDGILALFE